MASRYGEAEVGEKREGNPPRPRLQRVSTRMRARPANPPARWTTFRHRNRSSPGWSSLIRFCSGGRRCCLPPAPALSRCVCWCERCFGWYCSCCCCCCCCCCGWAAAQFFLWWRAECSVAKQRGQLPHGWPCWWTSARWRSSFVTAQLHMEQCSPTPCCLASCSLRAARVPKIVGQWPQGWP